MVTITERLNWWRKRSYYIGEEVNPREISYVTFDSNGNQIDGKSVVVDITIYTKSGNRAVERLETWVVNNASLADYQNKEAYRKAFTLSPVVHKVVFIRRRRWWL